GRARSIAGLETPDPATLVVRLDRPFADLPAVVAAIPLSPLPAALVRPAPAPPCAAPPAGVAATPLPPLPAALVRPDPAAYLTHPAGNGPFRLAAPARPGRSLTLERSPGHQASQIGRGSGRER